MKSLLFPDAYGELTEPTTLTIRRLLPGPIERVWAYITESELRRRWLAAGDMELKLGSSFELAWRNDELTDPPGERPPGFPAVHRMTCRITELEPLRKLSITWDKTGGVTFELAPQGSDVLLTVIHRRMPDRQYSLMFGAGWHMHLDILVAHATGRKTEPFWDGWARLKQEYDRRLPV